MFFTVFEHFEITVNWNQDWLEAPVPVFGLFSLFLVLFLNIFENNWLDLFPIILNLVSSEFGDNWFTYLVKLFK